MELLTNAFSGNISYALGWMILHLLWQATVIGIVAGIVLLVMRNRPARLRYRVANGALFSILVVAVGTFIWYNNAWKPDPIVPDFSDQQTVVTGNLEKSRFINTPDPGLTRQVPTQELSAASVSNYFKSNLPLVVALWFLGMTLFLLRLLGNIGYVFYLKRHLNFPADEYWDEVLGNMLRKTGIRRSVELMESALVRTPMLVGYLKPVILFPIGMINRLDPKEAEAILAHELAHILHHDYLFNILQSVIETLFYFHPAVWWLSSAIRHEREIAADDAAVAITGNSLQYAKALVIVQDMAFMPVSPSLAFAGNRKNQLIQRIQHILNIQQSKNSAMEKFIGTCAIVLLLLGLGYAQNRHMGGNYFLQTTESFEQYSGVWEGKIENDKLCLTLSSKSENHQWMHGDCYAKADFSALPTNGEGEFTMTRPAGVMTFKGKFEGNEGYGRFNFAADKSFADWLGQQGITKVDEDAMVHLFFANTDKNYVTSLKQAGYNKISGEDLQNLAIHQVSKELIESYRDAAKSLGDKEPDIDEVVTFKIHEVDKDYIKTLVNAGFKNLKMDDIVNGKIHEITLEYVEQCRKMGYSNLDFDDILNFKIHGMNAEYLSNLKNSGLTNLNAEDALNMKIHEVSPETIAEFSKMGFKDLDGDEIINLKIHEISPAFLADMQKIGFSNLKVDDAINLKIHGIDAAFIDDLKKAGFSNLDVDEAINCKIHGISAENVKALKQLGFDKITVDDAVNLNIHDIDAAFISDLKKAGFSNLDVDEVVSCKIHGITAAFVKPFADLGFKNISAEDAISLKIHDLTPAFIQDMRSKGFKDLSIEDYIELKLKQKAN